MSLLNVLPRFVFSLLLFYAAMPFLETYLISPIWRMKKLDLGTLPLPMCQKAIMDLGIFPTINEVKNMHSVLGEKKEVIDYTGKHTGTVRVTVSVDIDEFLMMIEKLTLAQLDNAAIVSLHSMFDRFADLHKGKMMLNKTSLSKLMDHLATTKTKWS